MKNVDNILASIAADNDGVVARSVAVEAGCPARAIDRRVTGNELVPMLPGVYRHAAMQETWLSRVRAAYLWAGDGAIIRGRTAAALYGLEGFSGGDPEIYVRSGRSHPSVRSKRIGRQDEITTRWRKGMRSTTVERTLFDLCGSAPPSVVGRAMDEALRKRITTVGRLADEAADHGKRGRRGSATFKKLVAGRDDREGKLRSEFERRMLEILRSIPSHHFEPNHAVRTASARYVLDFAVPSMRFGIECQSFEWHCGKEFQAADQARHRALVLEGWTIFYYSWDDVVFRAHEVKAEIARFLRSSLPLDASK